MRALETLAVVSHESVVGLGQVSHDETTGITVERQLSVVVREEPDAARARPSRCRRPPWGAGP